jgi:hypothetical protein
MPVPNPRNTLEEHDMPCIEALPAGTLALMTGYSQALQAALDPQHRLRMGAKISHNLSLLADHPRLSPGFHQVPQGLLGRWLAIGECTLQAMRGRDDAATQPLPPQHDPAPRFQMTAPKLVQ